MRANMVRSMTGFGHADGTVGQLHVSVEIRSEPGADPLKVRQEVLPGPQGLVEGSAEDSDGGIGLVEEVPR